MNALSARAVLRPILFLVLAFALAGCNDSAGHEGSAFFPIEVDGRWGVIDRRGRVVVEPSFSEVARSTLHDRAPFFIGQEAVLLVSPDKWLYVDSSGAQFVELPVAYDHGKLLIDYLGLSVFAVYGPEDFNASPFSPSHLLDPSGKWRPEHKLATYGEFSEGLIAIHREGKFGFADRQGQVVIEPQFDLVNASPGFSDGLAAVKQGELWGFVDAQGTWIIEPQYSMAHAFDEGVARVWPKEPDAPPLIIDRSGRVVHRWPDAYPASLIGEGFSEGLSLAHDDKTDLWGYLGHDGQWTIPPTYYRAKSFHEGLAPVLAEDPEQSGYIDHSDRLVVRVPGAQHLEWFSHGLAWVETSQFGGYINRTGNWVWKTKLNGLRIPGSGPLGRKKDK